MTMKKTMENKCDGRTKNHGKGKAKIEISKIGNTTQKNVAFSKRRMGLFKKALQYGQISGAKVAVIVFSSVGHLYTTDDDDNSVDAVVDEYLKLVDKKKDVNVVAASERKGESESETSNLIEWILQGMIEKTDNESIETLLEMKAGLEMIKEKVDNRLLSLY